MVRVRVKRESKTSRSKDKKRGPWIPWDLWYHGVSPSFIVGNLLRCRKQTEMRSMEGWHVAPGGGKSYIEFGQVFHHVMESAFAPHRLEKGLHAPKPAAIDGWILDYEKSSEAYALLDPEMRARISGMVRIVANAYFAIRSDAFKNTVAAREAYFKVPYTYPDGKTCTINGLIDFAYYVRKQLYIRDYKTSSEITDDTLLEMAVDFQMGTYCEASLLMFRQLPYAVYKEMIRRPGQEFTQKDTLESYLNKIETDVRKRPTHYFKRYQMNIRKDEHLHWYATQLHPIMAEVRLYAEGFGPWYNAKAKCPRTGRIMYPDAPRLPIFINPNGLKFNRAKSDYYAALTENDYTGLVKQGA